MQTVELVGRLLVSLLAVLAVVWLIGRKLRKGGRFKDTRLVDVLARQQLNRSASVAVLRVGDRALVVGVTDTQVSLLGETDLDSAQAAVANARAITAKSVPTGPVRIGGAPIAASVPFAVPTGPTVPTVPTVPTPPPAAFSAPTPGSAAPFAPAEAMTGPIPAFADPAPVNAPIAGYPSIDAPLAAAPAPTHRVPQRSSRSRSARAKSMHRNATPGTGPQPAGPLAGSALSPQTWRQTIESLRDLTSR
jgi:flagellar biogenesis protein FliO